MFTLYNSLIVPYLTCCVEVWGNARKTCTNSIFIFAKKSTNEPTIPEMKTDEIL